MRPGAPWDPRPDPDTDADVDQAIAAKLHISLRMLPILASAQLLGVEPATADLLPRAQSEVELAAWAEDVQLPSDPLFLDFESADGMPVSWEADTWPRPFRLRGTLCWRADVGLCVIPFGSVGGMHPWGGTDYQPWARWIFTAASEPQVWPPPGPGDFFADATGDATGWVDLANESICGHQGRVAFNLVQRALSILMVLDRLGVPLVERPLPRPARRRAKRAGDRIGLVPAGLPTPAEEEGSDSPIRDDEPILAPTDACPIARTHARLNQAHGLWHEALSAYAEPDLFVTKLNALIPSLRSVTFVMQKELRHTDGFEDWYAAWQGRMRDDRVMSWLVQARNTIEKQGDLDTHSIARVHVAGDWLLGPVAELKVSPTDTAMDLVRRLQIAGGLPDRVRREGVLVVERRWTVEDLDGQELLDALAHCFGVLAAIVADAHERAGTPLERCEAADEEHHAAVLALQPSGRPPCMAASQQARTSRRNLADGAPVAVGVREIERPTASEMDSITKRYGLSGKAQAAPHRTWSTTSLSFTAWDARCSLSTDTTTPSCGSFAMNGPSASCS